jgi:hypothetical protein
MQCDLLHKLELLHNEGIQFTPPHAREVVHTLYDILTVLDTKALALLAFDGIVVAAATFAAEKGGIFHRGGFPRWIAIFVIVVALAGAVLCLGVAEISYSFLHYVECSADKLDFAREIDHLATLVDWRTAYYRIAWWLSIIAIPSFLIMFWTSLSWPDGK